jgi:thiol-disulfide isomerase/thioredoxin
MAKFQQPDVWIGQDAPKLTLAPFVKGESVDKLEKGTTYVVEFWATWCGPCIRAFPHLSELANEYKDDVRVIGVNIWDTKEEESQVARSERVTKFVEGQGDRMDYTVAIEEGETMGNNWMFAAGRNGIPSAFIVNKEGKVAWMGHPMSMDEPLKQIVAGDWDVEKKAAEMAAAEQEQIDANPESYLMQKMQEGMMSADKAEAEEGYKIGRAMAAQGMMENPMALTSIAMAVLDDDMSEEFGIVHRDMEMAAELAEKAGKLTDSKDPIALGAHALAQYKTGDAEGAVKTQKMAIELLGDTNEDEMMMGEFQSRLDMFQKGM